MLKIRILIGINLGLMSLLVLLFTSCEKKTEDNKKTLDMVTIRTLGIAYLEENNLQEAEQQFLKLIELVPKESLGYANLGLVYMRMGKYSEAREQIRKALLIEPNDPDIRLNLAEAFELDNLTEESITTLENTVKQSPGHAKSLYKLAQFYSKSGNQELQVQGEALLESVVNMLPANIVARLQLIVILLQNGKADEARMNMEALRQQMPELPKESVEFFTKGMDLMASSNAKDALLPTMIFHNFMKVTPIYQGNILELKGMGGPLMGSPMLTFSRDITLQAQESESILEALRFTDATATSGLDTVLQFMQKLTPLGETGGVVALGDFDRDGDQDLYVAIWTTGPGKDSHFIFRNDFGRFIEISSDAGIRHVGKDLAAIFADFDNDGFLDLFLSNSEGNLLYQNVSEGKFRNVALAAGIVDGAAAVAAQFADFDHDGDLDLYMASAEKNYLYRNNLDGTFTELGDRMNISGAITQSRDITFGDFDDDGDLDLFVVNQNTSNILYTNLRQGRFQNITEASGLSTKGGSGAVTVGDYNNDGFLDLFVTALENGKTYLYRNRGDGTFEIDDRSKQMQQLLKKVVGFDTRFFDFDNDGFLDLLVAGKPVDPGSQARAVLLFHNDGTGKFEDMTSLLPENITSGSSFAVADYNEDGDMDIFITSLDGGIRLLRNDGGNVNKYLKVQLVGLRTGSGKNNHFGIGSKLEVRAGDLYQMLVVTEPVSHFGLGHRLKMDVVRILWPNGVPQNLFYPGSDQDLIEQQTLKGSCAFLYAWDGQKYEFVTDVMWRSALGMPLGIMGGETAYSFSSSSQDYFRIPGDKLKAKDGLYSMQITEELWETAYFDQLKLIAIDHPDSVDIFIDERFIPPPVPPLKIHTVTKRLTPESVIDDRGNNLLSLIRDKDDVYVSNLTPARFQGITEIHDIILDLGELFKAKEAKLFLNGWIYPSDASINVALSQSEQLKVIPPYLQVKDKRGNWQTVIENLSFPMGKDKMIIVDLKDKFLHNNSLVRIRTNMEIYWDYIFYTKDEPSVEIRKTILPPIEADLHYRGFSRLYRKGGRFGPHWFDYNDVTTGQKWRDLIGTYTRFGDVQPLLLESDDLYIIMNSGDELTVKFDASMAPEIKPGWTRDFLIYTDGWIKDGDLNTAYGKTVGPLPYHGMSSYPYGPNDSYPNDEKHNKYLKKYNKRNVTTDYFLKEVRK